MKTNKRGISLIVLVITIIVIIILAAAVILTLNNNNPIQNSKQATFDSDCDAIKSSMSLYIVNFMAKDPNHDSPFDTRTGTNITIGGSTDDDAEHGTLGTPATKATSVSWEALGLSGKPASVNTATYNAVTGKFTITPTNSGVTGKTDW